MSVKLESLELQIEDNSRSAGKGIDALASSLTKLRNATRDLSALSNTANSISKINEAVGRVDTTKLNQLANALSSLKSLRGIHVSRELPQAIAALSGTLTIITPQHIKNLRDLGESVQGLAHLRDVRLPSTFATRIRDIADALSRLNDEGIERLNRLADALRNVGSVGNVRVPQLRLPTLNPEQHANVNTPQRSDISEAQQALQEAMSESAQSIQTLRALSGAMEGIAAAVNVAAAAFTVFVRLVRGVVQVLRKLLNILYQVTAPLRKIGMSLMRALISPFTKAGESIKKTVKGLGQLLESFKRIAMYRLIRTAIASLTRALQEGINNLYQYSKLAGTDFAKSMDKIATSALYVKNSLAAMVSPIINAIAPAIDMLADKLVNVLNQINKAFAQLFGQTTYTAAKKVEAEFAKIKSHLIGIDELNVIEDDQPPYNEMFEELPLDGTNSFLEKLKKAFLEGDWQTLGEELGKKVNEAIDAIPWEEIGKTIGYYLDGAIKTAYYFLKEVDFQKAGEKVADLLNELLKAVDWEYAGRLLVEYFTSMWDFAIGFLKELDWGEVAHSIFSFIIGALKEFGEWLDEIDWVDLGETLLKKIQDFFENFDFKEVIRTISTVLGKTMKAMKDLLTPLWESFKEWWNEHIKGKDFLDTMKNLGEYLVKFVDEYVLTPFFKAFAGSGKKGSVDLSNINFEEQSVGELIESIIGDPDLSGLDKLKYIGKSIVAGILYGIHESIKDKWLLDFIVTPFLEIICRLFGIHSPAKTMIPIGENIMLGILKGMENIINGLGTWIKENVLYKFVQIFIGLKDWLEGYQIVDLKEIFGKELEDIGKDISPEIVDTSSFLEKTLDLILQIGNWIIEFLVNPFKTFLKVLENIIEALKLILELLIKICKEWKLTILLKDLATKAILAIKQLLESLKDKVITVTAKLVDLISSVVSVPVAALESLADKIYTVYLTAVETVSAVVEAAKAKVGEFAGQVATATLAAVETVTAVVEAAKAKVGEFAGQVATATLAVVETVTAVVEAAKAKVGEFAGLVATATLTAVETVSSVVAAAKAKVGEFAGLVATATITAKDAVAGAVSSAKGALQGVASGMYQAAITAKDAVAGAVSSAKGALQGVASGMYQAAITAKDAVAGAASSAKGRLQSVASGLYQAVVSAKDSVASAANSAKGKLQSVASGLYQASLTAKDEASNVISSVKSALDSIPTAVAVTITIGVVIAGAVAALSGIGGLGALAGLAFAKGGIFTQPVFFHALGGIIDKPIMFHAGGGLHVAGEAGREAILPLQNHTEWMNEVAERTRDAIAQDEPDNNAFYSTLGHFFVEYLNPVMTEIARDTKRQADKDEHPVVKIGNKDIRDAYNTQTKADGYKFTR